MYITYMHACIIHTSMQLYIFTVHTDRHSHIPFKYILLYINTYILRYVHIYMPHNIYIHTNMHAYFLINTH